MSELRDFLVPDLGEGLEEATVVSWLVAVGDEVRLNQPVCLVETAKAEVEVPTPYAGRVRRLGGAEGETLAVGTLLIRIELAGDPLTGDPAAEPEDAADRPEPTLVGYGLDDAIDRSRRGERGVGGPRGRAGTPSPPTQGARSRPLAKPPVRMLARKLGVDLAALAPGSGPGGIVTRGDVERSSDPADTHTPDVEVLPVRGVRARIAERMAISRREIADATCSVTADCERLLVVRKTLNTSLVSRGLEPAITPFSLMCTLFVRALCTHPELNARFVAEGPEIQRYRSIHLGVGTATDRGLLVTVIRGADQRSVDDLSRELARLSRSARDGSLGPADLQGSTVTVSNFGALGLDEGIPVINHPEAAILGIGAVRQRPQVRDDIVVPRHTACLTLAFDHRVADGAEAAALLCTLRDLIEAPELALVHP